jgi:hypothetical protein
MPAAICAQVEMSQIEQIAASKKLIFGVYGSAIILCLIWAGDTNKNRYGARIAPGEK